MWETPEKIRPWEQPACPPLLLPLNVWSSELPISPSVPLVWYLAAAFLEEACPLTRKTGSYSSLPAPGPRLWPGIEQAEVVCQTHIASLEDTLGEANPLSGAHSSWTPLPPSSLCKNSAVAVGSCRIKWGEMSWEGMCLGSTGFWTGGGLVVVCC